MSVTVEQGEEAVCRRKQWQQQWLKWGDGL